MLRGHAGEPAHVLVLLTLGATQRRFIAGRWSRRTKPEPAPEPVPTTKATLIGATPFKSQAEAETWLADADLEHETAVAVAVLNGVLYAHQIAAADELVHEVTRAQALVVRLGIGEGDQVAYGRWAQARALARDRARADRRSNASRTNERLAALLAGRDVALAAEVLTLRAHLDQDRGRFREAALQLRVALEAGLAELAPWAGNDDLSRRLEELAKARSAIDATASCALEGGLDDKQIEVVSHVLGRLEAALAARTATGID